MYAETRVSYVTVNLHVQAKYTIFVGVKEQEPPPSPLLNFFYSFPASIPFSTSARNLKRAANFRFLNKVNLRYRLKHNFQ